MKSKKPGKVSQPTINQSNKISDFFTFLTRKSKSNNIDQYFRNGSITGTSELFEIGKYFLNYALGADEHDFLPSLKYKDFACFVPQSENYYPWAFFVLPTSTSDLSEFFDHHGRPYLLSADSGKKDFAIVTNLKTLSVFNHNHHDEQFEISFADLYDGFNGDESKESLKNWSNFITEFGPEKVQDKKKTRRKEVINYQKPKESTPELQYVKKFGHIPSFEIPVGYDGNNFRETFKTKEELPFLTTEIIDWDRSVKKVENKLIWGDNLAVMRSLPSESIDLIYIDPPFFSGRDYNCIFGDDDEVRSFKDIWDGGLPTYLAWLNARLWEIKRLLKPTGSLFLHLDWHAVHYVKCELDKIFGYNHFLNEIAWCYAGGGISKKNLPRKHDTILWYKKGDLCFYDPPLRMYSQTGSGRHSDGSKYCLETDKTPHNDWWTDIPILNTQSKERIGYPTQKSELLLERIINMASQKGDIIADFFSGGGTTITVAEKLGRKWIGVDISRIAVSIARDRLLSIYEKDTGIKPLKDKPTYGFNVDYHGIYERDLVRELSTNDYVSFILKCYGTTHNYQGEFIHGIKDNKAIFVAPPKENLKNHHIQDFCADLVERKIQNGIVLAWNISKEAEKFVAELRKGAGGVDIQLIQVKLVDIDSNEFKGENIKFINKPAALFRSKQKSGLTWEFDASGSCGSNNSDIHYFQWDFNHKNKFAPSTKPNFKSETNKDGNSLNNYKKIEFTFPSQGEFTVALRIFDKSGADAIITSKLSVSKKTKKAA